MLHFGLKLFSYQNLFNHLVDLDINNRLPSKILLSGQEGIGKTTFAIHFINYLLSKNEVTKYDIKKNTINYDSKSLILVNNNTHPNFFLISKKDEKKNIEIEQVRYLINFLNKSSLNNSKKIILIDGAEYLNPNSSNALLKNLEDSNDQNLFILTHDINKNIYDTIKSRCITFKLNFNYSETKNILSEHFSSNIYEQLNKDFKLIKISPSFLINHIIFLNDNKIDINLFNIENTIKFIIDDKSYKKNSFITKNFQRYIEIFFFKMYLKTNDYKYYDFLIKTALENNQINKFNLDLDSFFIKFENKYLNI